MERRPYRPYQKDMDAYAHGPAKKHPLLYVDMRLGKTLVTVRSLRGQRGLNTLITAPYSALPAWRKEMHLEGIEWTELLGAGAERRSKLSSLSGYVLTNKDVWQSAPDIKDLNWHRRVLDESTFIKNPFAKITKFYNDPAWGGLIQDWRLTGTPNPEGDLDFYSQAPGIWPQKNFYEWRGHWFCSFGMEWLVKPRLSKAFHSVLARHAFFLNRRDAGVGGKKIYETRLVKTSPELKSIYKKLAKEFILEIPEGEQWETEFAGVKYSWLRRLCGGALPSPDGTIRGWWPGKMNALISDLRGELSREQVVIWAHFKEEVERIHKNLSGHGPTSYIHGDVSPRNREIIIEDFRKGKYKWLVAQPACLRYSTDLSFLDTEAYYSSPQGFETRFQSEDRLITGSKETASLVLDYVVEGTLEEDLQTSLMRKESRTETCRRIVQGLQREILRAA